MALVSLNSSILSQIYLVHKAVKLNNLGYHFRKKVITSLVVSTVEDNLLIRAAFILYQTYFTGH